MSLELVNSPCLAAPPTLPPAGSRPGGGPPGPPRPRDENGDFDDRAAEFWSVYVKEAQRHDDALIGTWKEDMEGVIIFVRSSIPL
jgi:hypothetical protein